MTPTAKASHQSKQSFTFAKRVNMDYEQNIVIVKYVVLPIKKIHVGLRSVRKDEIHFFCISCFFYVDRLVLYLLTNTVFDSVIHFVFVLLCNAV